MARKLQENTRLIKTKVPSQITTFTLNVLIVMQVLKTKKRKKTAHKEKLQTTTSKKHKF